MKTFNFTALLSLMSPRRPVVSVSVKELKSPFGSCVSKRSAKLNAYRLFKRGFLFLMEYISSSYSNKVYLPLALIRDAIDNNWLDSLCYYVWMKKMHHRPVIYNYSLRKIGAGINCSPTTIKTHISVLKRHELIQNGAGNLILKSTRQLFKENKLMVPVQVSDYKQQQRTYLRFAAIKRNLHSQVRAYTQKSNALNSHKGLVRTYNGIKAGIRLMKKYPCPVTLEKTMNSELTLSNESFGSLCNRSKSTGLKIQKALNDIGLIVSYGRTKLIDAKRHLKREFYRLELGSNYFLSYQGMLYQRLSNGIKLR